jgi:hypothetical protein
MKCSAMHPAQHKYPTLHSKYDYPNSREQESTHTMFIFYVILIFSLHVTVSEHPIPLVTKLYNKGWGGGGVRESKRRKC